ncbi:MAG: pilus assembly protein TadG-related protein [Planctomycetaceae bacterium]
MENLTRTSSGTPGPMARFHDDENGKVTLLASLLMLGLVSLAGLVGNVGHVTKEKIETQNAADAVAYSSSLWMARGMNALTATNHMLGEATAIAAIHEAIGGPELDLGIKANPPENIALNRTITGFILPAPIAPSPFGYTPKPIIDIDRKVVEFVIRKTSPPNDEMRAFATIYDSRMALKRQLAVILPIKSFANAGFFVPPPWGIGTAALAYGVHIAGTANIVLIGKEWFVLKALEAIAVAFKPVKKIVETQLIPTLSAHAAFVAGYYPKTGKSKPGILNQSVERLVQDLQQRLYVEASLFPEFKELRLPVVAEPKPSMRGSTSPTRGWGSDKPPVFTLPELNLGGMKRKINKAMRAMEKRSRKLSRDIVELAKYEKDIDKRLKEDDVGASEKAELLREKQEIEESRIAKRKRIDEIDRELKKLNEKLEGMEEALNKPLPAESNNLSVKSIPNQLNQQQERYTQWVRASYPHVDGFRAPFRAWLKQWAPKSRAMENFDKWSNRYTLVKSWQFRSGHRPRKGNRQVSWSKKKEPLRMLVMKDTYQGRRDRKGREKWTGTSKSSKLEAEKLFTVVGVAHRDYQPLFSEVLYPAPSDTGLTTYAQAIFYNANRQRPASGRGRTQAKIGWDTLNWDPAISVPEWGAPAFQAAVDWPWNAFNGKANQKVARVKLNWQAKLMPVQTSRLKDASVTLTGSARKNVEQATKHFDKLGTH